MLNHIVRPQQCAAMSLTETTILSQAPGPKLWLISTFRGSGGVHSVRLYWIFIRPTSMGAICT